MSIVDLDPNRTIVAVASPPGRSIRGIVRMSGSQTIECLNQVCHPVVGTTSRAAAFETHLRIDGVSIPVAARVLVWPDQRSYTRQPSAEIHLDGCTPVIDALIATL